MSHANEHVQNWSRTLDSFPREVVAPRSVEEIQEIVRNVEKHPSPVRAVGSNHSTTACGVSDGGTLLDMSVHMNRILEIDETARTVTAQAGALYVDVAQAVGKKNLQFHVNVELGNLSLGSGCCGGTKDASMPGESSHVCSYAIEIKLVQADGSLRTVREGDDLMPVMRSSYGLLGIVYEVTFRLKELTPISFENDPMSIDEFVSRFDLLRQSRDSLMLYVMPFLDKIVVERRKDSPPGTKLSRIDHWKWMFRNWVWKFAAPATGRVVTRLVPLKWLRYKLIDAFNRLVCEVLEDYLKGAASNPTDQIIRYPGRSGLGMYTFSIWAFPEEEFPDVLRSYVAFCRDYYACHGYRCNMLNVGYRFARDQNSLFSYSYDGNMWSLDIVSTGDPGWDRFLWSYNAFCSERGGKPLFNQTKAITRNQVRRAFGPKLDVFRTHRREQDPEGRFVNSYFAWLLGE